MNGNFIRRVHALLSMPELNSLSKRYRENQENRLVNLGFNPFALVSSIYHRENFHSDILKEILDPTGAHGQGTLFLQRFLIFLSEKHSVEIDPANYLNATVKREPGRIDLFICDDTTRRALIIENKVNGAQDMERQIIRYLEKAEDGWGYTCDGIIYLTLDRARRPAMEDWDAAERSRVTPLLRSVTAFEDSSNDLHHGWIIPCIEACDDGEVTQVIRQYDDLLKKLGRNAMNKPLLKEFYDLMRDPELSRAARSLQSLLVDLLAYRANRIIDYFSTRSYPFSAPWPHDNTVAVFQGLESTKGWEAASRLKIHVDCTLAEKTVVNFWDNNDIEQKLPKLILSQLGMHDWLPGANDWPSWSFSFPEQEAELDVFLERFPEGIGSI